MDRDQSSLHVVVVLLLQDFSTRCFVGSSQFPKGFFFPAFSFVKMFCVLLYFFKMLGVNALCVRELGFSTSFLPFLLLSQAPDTCLVCFFSFCSTVPTRALPFCSSSRTLAGTSRLSKT